MADRDRRDRDTSHHRGGRDRRDDRRRDDRKHPDTRDKRDRTRDGNWGGQQNGGGVMDNGLSSHILPQPPPKEEEKLDENKLMAMMTTGDDEEKLIAERKRKREEIKRKWAEKKAKADDDGKKLDSFAGLRSKAAAEEPKDSTAAAAQTAPADATMNAAAASSSLVAAPPGKASPPLLNIDLKGLQESVKNAQSALNAARLSAGIAPDNSMLINGEIKPVSGTTANSAGQYDMFGDNKTGPNGPDGVSLGLMGGTGEFEDQGNFADADGYYNTRTGELLGDRYRVLGKIGAGVFSTVLKCKDERLANREVAVKFIRNNDTMRRAALREVELLQEIARTDPQNKKHNVRMIDNFSHKDHPALVFEFFQMNLRETLKKFGKGVGINVTSVRVYGKQLLVALRHLESLKIVHADIKLDNILVNNNCSMVKICDFGSAFKVDSPDNEVTPYLVSRYYRAPEIILALPYNHMIDVWAVATCLFELYTGHILYQGGSNNEMLKFFMDYKGAFPNKMLRKHRQTYQEKILIEPHFHSDFRFRYYETDRVTLQKVLRLVHIPEKPVKSFQDTLLSSKSASDEKQVVLLLKDLVDKMCILDPEKRLSTNDALAHPFICSPSGRK